MKTLVLGILLTCYLENSMGAVVAGWNVNAVSVATGVGVETNESPYTFIATTAGTGRVSAELKLGAGVKPSTSSDSYGFKIETADRTSSLASAISSDHYIEIAISIEDGYELNLTTLELFGESTGDGCSNIACMTSVTGFSAGNEIALASNVTEVTGGFDTDANGFGDPIDLSGNQFQRLNGEITFRLYGWNSTSGAGETRLRDLTGNDLVINGTVTPVGFIETGVVAGWDVFGVDVDDGIGIATNEAPYPFAATTSDFVYVSSTLLLGSGVNPSTTSNQYGFKIPGTAETLSLSEAIENNHYIEISMMVDAGYVMNLNSVEMMGMASASGCSNVAFMSSVAGFTNGNELAVATNVNVGTGGFDTDASGFGGPIDLSVAGYQGLKGTNSFRIYGWGSTSGSGATYLRDFSNKDDLQFFGTVVPNDATDLPYLSVVSSNGLYFVQANGSGAGLMLQFAETLSESNQWTTVCDSYACTPWEINTVSTSGFYRVIKY